MVNCQDYRVMSARSSLLCFNVGSMLAWVVNIRLIYYLMALLSSCLLHRDVTYEEEVGECG